MCFGQHLVCLGKCTTYLELMIYTVCWVPYLSPRAPVKSYMKNSHVLWSTSGVPREMHREGVWFVGEPVLCLGLMGRDRV